MYSIGDFKLEEDNDIQKDNLKHVQPLRMVFNMAQLFQMLCKMICYILHKD